VRIQSILDSDEGLRGIGFEREFRYSSFSRRTTEKVIHRNFLLDRLCEEVMDLNPLVCRLWSRLFRRLHLQDRLDLCGCICSGRSDWVSLCGRRPAAWLIAKTSDWETGSAIIERGDADATDWCFELDQGMSVVVPVRRQCLTVGTEVSVIAYSALVTDALNIGEDILVLAEGTITVDTNVASTNCDWLGQGLVDGHKTVSRVGRLCGLDALGTEVPVWAV
jgi:hypothetical protein